MQILLSFQILGKVKAEQFVLERGRKKTLSQNISVQKPAANVISHLSNHRLYSLCLPSGICFPYEVLGVNLMYPIILVLYNFLFCYEKLFSFNVFDSIILGMNKLTSGFSGFFFRKKDVSFIFLRQN